MLWIEEDPAYNFLKADPQFQSILSRIGRPHAPSNPAPNH